MPLRFLTAGESHGTSLVAVLEGLPAGLPLGEEQINPELIRRQQGYGAGPRMKLEHDRARILSGVMAGKTIGSPVAFLIHNLNHERWKGKAIDPMTAPRPGHVDLAAALKYGYNDLRPGLERASARETAARVAVGAACKALLQQFGIWVGGYTRAIGTIEIDLPEEEDFLTRFLRAEQNEVRCPDLTAAGRMRSAIQQAIQARDTLGGILEIFAIGLPPGLGSHVQWDRRLEARLGAAVLSVQAIKGVEFGPAFENSRLPGTQVHDPIHTDGERLIRSTHRSGGLEGGITTGQPLLIRAAMKPIATTLTPQPTVDLTTHQETPTVYERSDFCPVPRAVPILEAMVAFVLADALLEKLGGDSLDEMLPRFKLLRQNRLSDLDLEGEPQIFWPDKTE